SSKLSSTKASSTISSTSSSSESVIFSSNSSSSGTSILSSINSSSTSCSSLSVAPTVCGLKFNREHINKNDNKVFPIFTLVSPPQKIYQSFLISANIIFFKDLVIKLEPFY